MPRCGFREKPPSDQLGLFVQCSRQRHHRHTDLVIAQGSKQYAVDLRTTGHGLKVCLWKVAADQERSLIGSGYAVGIFQCWLPRVQVVMRVWRTAVGKDRPRYVYNAQHQSKWYRTDDRNQNSPKQYHSHHPDKPVPVQENSYGGVNGNSIQKCRGNDCKQQREQEGLTDLKVPQIKFAQADSGNNRCDPYERRSGRKKSKQELRERWRDSEAVLEGQRSCKCCAAKSCIRGGELR